MKIPTLLVALLVTGPALAGLGTSGGHDLDALWTQAQAAYDLDRQDAVILIHDTRVTVRDDGGIATRVHTLVWIGTSRGIRSYADLRVPWNSATSTLDVEILRTWRDDRWWPDAERISDTAVVHTLPYALRNAYDYDAQRETMLLHDGVELPCLMETAYTITEQGRPAVAGFRVLPQDDPAVRVSCSVRVPAGSALHHASLNGAPAADAADGGVTWVMERVPARARPRTAAPAAHEPTVAWSTWSAQDAADRTFGEAFAAAAAEFPTNGLADQLAAAVRPEPGSLAVVRAVADFLAENVRHTAYDPTGWRFSPRPAARIWQTAHGHALDQAVLATAVYRHLGFRCEPLLVGHADGGDLAGVPGHLGLDGIRLLVSGGGLSGGVTYDPGAGTVTSGPPVGLRIRGLSHPELAVTSVREDARCEVVLVFRPDGGGWTGSGMLRGGGGLIRAADPASGPTALADCAAAVVSGLVPGATAARVACVESGRGRFAAEFAVALADSQDRAAADTRSWRVGRIAGGVRDALPADVDLADETRSSPVMAPVPLAESVELRLDLAGEEIVHLPPDVELANTVGTFRAGATREGDWVVYRRELSLAARHVRPGDWPSLRALLLAADDPAHATIVTRPLP